MLCAEEGGEAFIPLVTCEDTESRSPSGHREVLSLKAAGCVMPRSEPYLYSVFCPATLLSTGASRFVVALEAWNKLLMGFIPDPPITEEERIGKEASLDSLKLEPPITGPGAAGSSDSPKLSTKEFTITSVDIGTSSVA